SASALVPTMPPTHPDDLLQLADGLFGTGESGDLERDCEAFTGDCPRPRELPQAVRPVDPAEAGVLGATPRQAGHRGVREHRIDAHHARIDPAGDLQAVPAAEHRRTQAVPARVRLRYRLVDGCHLGN